MNIVKPLRPLVWSSIFAVTSILSACGGSGEDATDTTAQTACSADVGTSVNWEALLTENCERLSDYNLFADATDPTSNPNETGIPYEMNTALFTDYATKYRYVFVPEGETATYSEHEVMEFPVGTVLVKTFSLPENTANRDGAETIIETRLLIHRADGWTALPYYWDTTSDASYAIAGKTISNVSLVHNEQTMTFDYVVPQKAQCTRCHSIEPIRQGLDDKRLSIFKPIGPKARYLNHDYEYETGTENQLAHWANAGIITGVPNDNNTIDTAADFHDDVNIAGLTNDELTLAARSYLDINCAHCHRSELTIPEEFYNGAAGDSGLQVEFNRDFDADPLKFGVCKSAVASGHVDHPKDIIPGRSDKSYLPYRMNSLEGTHKMPELGRSTVHTEGVELINAWIDAMPADNCNLTL